MSHLSHETIGFSVINQNTQSVLSVWVNHHVCYFLFPCTPRYSFSLQQFKQIYTYIYIFYDSLTVPFAKTQLRSTENISAFSANDAEISRHWNTTTNSNQAHHVLAAWWNAVRCNHLWENEVVFGDRCNLGNIYNMVGFEIITP